MAKKIRVAILDDHQSIIDGYLYRLNQTPGIEVVATATFSTDMEQIIARQPVDVLLMDVQVPMSPDNPNPHPILNLIPQLRQTYPDLVVLVISMHADRALIKSVIAAGASGYILKEDRATIRDLGNVLLTVARGGIYFSRQAHEQILDLAEEPLLTTRQLEVLSMFAALPDLTSTAVAAKLNITDSTVRNLLSGVYLRLGVHNRTAAIMKARQLGLLTPSASASDFSTDSA